MTHGLTAAERQQFEENGYLVVDDLFDEAAVMAPVRREYEALLESVCRYWVAEGLLEADCLQKSFSEQIKQSYDAQLDYFQPLDISLPPGDIQADTPFHAGPAIFNLMVNDALLDVIEALIGPEITSNPIQHVRIKPPVTALQSDEARAQVTYTDWHQDRAVTLAEADNTRMVTAWVAVNDATVANGCLKVIPGSHRGDMLEHCPAPQLGIPTTLFDESQARPIPVRAGGAIVFHPLTVHGSLENTTSDIRWSFDIRYNVTGDPTGRPMFPHFVARSASDPQSELRDANTWQAMWEEARRRLARDAPVAIHRWSGDHPVCA